MKQTVRPHVAFLLVVDFWQAKHWQLRTSCVHAVAIQAVEELQVALAVVVDTPFFVLGLSYCWRLLSRACAQAVAVKTVE